MTPARLARELGATMRFILEHPNNRHRPVRAVGRFVGWQVWKRVTGRPVDYPYWDGLKVRVYPDSKSGGLAIYTGLPEYDDMLFVTRFLRAGDRFVDVGANIGLYSLLAARAAGAAGEVLAFEPHPVAAARLAENARLNRLGSISVHEAAVGSASGTARLTANLDTVNHVVLEAGAGPTVEVPVVTLDAELGDRPVAILKIDAEGFESEVLAGADRLLSERRVEALIVELREHGARYGGGDAGVVALLRERGYRPFRYHASRNRLEPLAEAHAGGEWNAIFLADLAEAERRLSSHP